MAAAAESFLAFNPAAPPGPSAASRRRSRGPRNRKKGWKRWSGPEARLGREIGDFLEDVGLQERAAGGLISDQPNKNLFFLDTGNAPKSGRPKKPPQKPLHVDLVLQPLSKVPPPKNILAHQTPNGRKDRRRREFWAKKAEKGIFPRRERRLLARLRPPGTPKITQEPPKNHQEPPKNPQEPPKNHQEPPKTTQEPPKTTQEPPKNPQEPPKNHQEPPKNHQEPPKNHQEPPKNPQEPPKNHQEPPKNHQESPKNPQEPPKNHQEPPKNHQEPPKNPKPPELGRSDPHRSFYDIWGEHNPLDAPLAGQDPWYLQQTKRQRVQRPPRLQAKPSPLPPVEVIGQGGSYNPPFQDHQALLLRALEVEMRRRREEEKVERRLKVTEEPPSQESLVQEQLQGLLEEEEEEEEEEGQEQPQEPPRKREQPGRKTERQRRREREHREKAAARSQSRLAMQRLQGLFQLHSLRRALRRRELQLRRRRELREQRRKIKEWEPKRLGRVRYEDLGPEVQLSEELPESLRSLRPEGSVLRDRFRSLQRRNIIEPRERAKFRRRYRVKLVEKRSFRSITL